MQYANKRHLAVWWDPQMLRYLSDKSSKYAAVGMSSPEQVLHFQPKDHADCQV